MTVLHESIEVSRPVHEVFAYIADFSTTQEWDSTVTCSEKLTPGPVSVGTQFAVNCSAPVGSIDIEYTVIHIETNVVIELSGTSRFFDISDQIRFTPTTKGTRVDYRAEFTFPHALQRFAKSFEAGLERMGKHSMEGMRAALDQNYSTPSTSRATKLGDRLLMPALANFTRFGYSRSRKNWLPNSSHMKDKHVVVTGASSGLGYATAMEIARRGARLTLVVRDEVKGRRVVEEITAETGNDRLSLELADLSLLEDVDRLVRRLSQRGEALDVLVNNAGALFNPRQETAEGIESSLALLLLSPYLLTTGLKPLLAKADQARVINVVSGGMYSQKLDIEQLLNNPPDRYSGSVAYARAKRALMVLSEEWATDWAEEGITVNAMHPGWADTPGVESALPQFHKLTRHFLRTVEQGADTIVWLASAREAARVSGKLFLDREPHTTHLLPSTRESDEERRALLRYLSDFAHHSGGDRVAAALLKES